MKTLITLILFSLIGLNSIAQAPRAFKYQAVARNTSGEVLANKSVSFRIGILSSSATGTAVYSETHTGKTTNAFGLVDLEIGKGIPVTGSFAGINWGAGDYFLKVEMDPNGGTSYQAMGTSQLLSVPYALYAREVENNADGDADATNELQKISISGTVLTLDKSGGSVTLPSGGTSGDNWGTQAVLTDGSLTGNGTGTSLLKIADNGVTSAKIQDNGVVTADLADQTVSTAKLGNLAVSADKIQNGAVITDKLANNAVIAEKIANGAITGAKIAQAGATTGQALKWNGTAWAPAADATGGSSSGWTDDGAVIRLTTTSDSVQIGNMIRLGKLNVGGDIGLNLLSNIYFGSDKTRITGLTGGDMRLVAEDLSMLTTEDITFGRFGDATWIKFDNANKRVGIGTLAPTEKLHVVLNQTSEGLSAVRGVAASAAGAANGVYGQAAGSKGRGVMGEATGTSSIGVMGLATNTSSTGVWGEGSNQGVYGKSDMTTGKGVFGQVTSATGYSGYFDGGKFYVSGNTGIGTTSPAKKLHVNGSAQVKDTLFASAVKVTNSPRVFYKKNTVGIDKPITTLNSWGPLDTLIVEAPGPGFVMLNFTGALFTNHNYLDGTWVGVGISTKPTSSVLAQTWWEFEHQLVGGVYQSPTAVTTVATVTTAGTYNYYIVGYHWGTTAGEDVVYLEYESFSALFIPAP